MRNLGSLISDEFGKEQVNLQKHLTKGVHMRQINTKGINGTFVHLDNDNSLNRPAGNYYTFDVECLSEKSAEAIEKLLTKALKKLLPTKFKSVLILGMGNAEIISDTLGVKTIEPIDVLDIMDKTGKKIAKFLPSVFSVSGLESIDVINGIVNATKPEAVIVVDSLCTRELGRLGRSFQICDAGITPGSAVGKNICNLSKDTLGTTVISIGVPVVVYLHSVVQEIIDNLKPSNYLNLRALRQNFDEVDAIFSPKDIDFIINFSAQRVSRAIINAITTI